MNKKGFTLIEIVMIIVLLGIIMQGGEILRKYEEVYLSNMRITGGCIP